MRAPRLGSSQSSCHNQTDPLPRGSSVRSCALAKGEGEIAGSLRAPPVCPACGAFSCVQWAGWLWRLPDLSVFARPGSLSSHEAPRETLSHRNGGMVVGEGACTVATV